MYVGEGGEEEVRCGFCRRKIEELDVEDPITSCVRCGVSYVSIGLWSKRRRVDWLGRKKYMWERIPEGAMLVLDEWSEVI